MYIQERPDPPNSICTQPAKHPTDPLGRSHHPKPAVLVADEIRQPVDRIQPIDRPHPTIPTSRIHHTGRRNWSASWSNSVYNPERSTVKPRRQPTRTPKPPKSAKPSEAQNIHAVILLPKKHAKRVHRSKSSADATLVQSSPWVVSDRVTYHVMCCRSSPPCP